MKSKYEERERKHKEQLGMAYSVAYYRLRRNLTFHLANQLNLTICYRCGKHIEDVEQLSIDHKEHWLDSSNPSELFFDLNNIAFSHITCNNKARNPDKSPTCPSRSQYNKGCRCEGCCKVEKVYQDNYTKRKRNA